MAGTISKRGLRVFTVRQDDKAVRRRRKHRHYPPECRGPATGTVLRIIKLNLFSVPVRWHAGSGKFINSSLFHHILRYLRALCIVWNLVRRRVTRRLTKLPTIRNVCLF